MAGGITPADAVRLPILVGPATYARGLAYAKQGAVLHATWDADGTQVTGRIAGTGPAPYEVTAAIKRAASGALSEVSAECTCPVGWNCKHAVALLLAASLSPHPEAARSRARSVWSDLVEHDQVDESDEPAEMALQFELVGRRPPAGRRQVREDDPGQPGIRLRPVVPGARGWVRTGVTWNRLDYMGHTSRHHLQRDRLDLLREMRALAALSGSRGWTVYSDDTIWLESIDSRRLWDLLVQAHEVGLPLVQSGRNTAVELLPEPLVLGVDLHLDENGELIAESSLPADHVFVGRPAHGLAWWQGRADANPAPALHLAALSAPLPDHLRRVVEARRTSVGDREFFEAKALPALRKRLRVTSSDEAIDLPEIGPDHVVLTVSYVKGPAIQAVWTLEAAGRSPRPVAERPDAEAGHVLDRATARLGPELTAPNRFEIARPIDVRLTGLDAARFATDALPSIEAVGVEVREVGDRPDFREVHEAPIVRWSQAAPGEGDDKRDWYDLTVALTVAGEEVRFSDLFTALAEGISHLLLPSGAYFSLDTPEIKKLAELIEEARAMNDAPPGAVRISRYQSSLLDDLAGLGKMGPEILEPLTELSEDPMDRAVPSTLEATLRPYQVEGFQWLASRWERGLGAVLADDMGLGKTLQALAVIAYARESRQETRPWLVVAPTSVVGNWARESHRFLPGVEVRVVTETSRKRDLVETVDGAAIVLTSYTLFRIDHAEYERIQWAGLLLDEAQFAKNPNSHANQRARKLQAPWKLAMTGTPMENSLSELWAITAITSPGLLGRLDRFEQIYRRPIEKQGSAERLEQLRRRIKPWMLRRTKEEVAPELPPKQEQVLALELDPRHRRLYDTYLQRERQKVLGLLDDMKTNRFEILRSLTMLRQAALDLALVDPKHEGVPSTKLDALTDMVSDIVADGHRVLIFSQFTRFLESARRRIGALGIDYAYLDGRTRNRTDVIERFRSQAAPVFLISLKAGGFGLNLTEADYCILLDPWWNPAAEAQAVDRAHRIGQTRPVMVYRLVAADTIEDKVMALRDRKAALFASVMSGGGFESARLDADDVRALLDV